MFYRPRSRNTTSNRHTDTIDISQALNEMLSEGRMEKKYQHVKAIQLWKEVMGNTVASRTEKIFMSKSSLYIKLNSAPLKNELSLSKELIRTRINDELGEEAVQGIVFL